MSMNIELKKTVGYDVGLRSGKSVCHQTLTAPIEDRGSTILKDVAQIVNEAGFNGATVKEQLPIARLIGYVEALATAIALAEACGISFTTSVKRDGTESLAAELNFKAPKAIDTFPGIPGIRN